MAQCDVCGNEYENAFSVTMKGETHTFDSFECAIHMLAPTCSHCSCRIIGHGLQAGDQVFCCASCARQAGITELKDSS